ncbi:MAG: 50S ribosomal protein L3 [Candidatus Spechtbacteria bacterium]|nr:50S ribosomal protein L3 [Candidatus Spechtbacteria bacterium]
MKFLLGKKIEMTQVFSDGGKVIPVTLVEAGPVVVTQIRTKEKDGYQAVQVGFGKKKHLTKSIKGHLKNLGDFRWLREYKIVDSLKNGEPTIPKVGEKIDVSIFKEGNTVGVRGISKGKGFQGVVKRHGFKGMKATHGTKEKYRAPGAIGSRFPQHVRKGKRMGGRMGHERVTRRAVEIVKIDVENNLLALKGAIPGPRGSLVEIRG